MATLSFWTAESLALSAKKGYLAFKEVVAKVDKRRMTSQSWAWHYGEISLSH